MFANKCLHRVLCFHGYFPQRKMSSIGDVQTIFRDAVASVQPRALLRNNMKIQNSSLVIQNQVFGLQKPCYLVGFGKAVYGMALEAERILGAHLKEGIVVIPAGSQDRFKKNAASIHPQSRLQFVEGARNNLPDTAAMDGAQMIKNLCDRLASDDLLIVLISGGGSALLPLPKAGISLSDKLLLIKMLANAGADILELNTVRKRISVLKGGGLAESASPATVASLILSDVIGDPLDFIASGPTVRNLDEPSAALRILNKYNLTSKVPPSILQVLNETFVAGNAENARNFIIGNNKLACEMARTSAENLGYRSVVLSTQLCGDVGLLASMYAELAAALAGNDVGALKVFQGKFKDLNIGDLKGGDKGVCVVGGGEPTVVVKGGGKGGRNQQLALCFSQELLKFKPGGGVTFLSCGTDGIDGPTDAAGAIGTNTLAQEAREDGMVLDSYLSNNDSNGFYKEFRKGVFLVQTGHTGTNVMDIHLLIVKQ